MLSYLFYKDDFTIFKLSNKNVEFNALSIDMTISMSNNFVFNANNWYFH